MWLFNFIDILGVHIVLITDIVLQVIYFDSSIVKELNNFQVNGSYCSGRPSAKKVRLFKRIVPVHSVPRFNPAVGFFNTGRM